MNIKILLAIWLAIFSLPLFAKQNVISNQTPEKNIYTEDKQTILVSSDQPEFVLRLKSNPSTGYTWFLREYDAALIQPLKHVYEPSASELIGSAGFEEWTFKVKPEGFIVPWQSNDASTQLVFRISTQSKK
jgi:inhibitor of cysteine peptidase